MIIYHQRRCNFDEETEKTKEEGLMGLLYNNEIQPDTCLVCVKCGWTKQEIR